jgi:2-polyprenyl-6-hydroxyphenyl methylase/3-demethylubiquinone-9 3-methyltransferase
MDWAHDVHDWLGGHPYESTSPDEVRRFLAENNFTILREFVLPPSNGLWGAGCDEYVARRLASQ